MPTLPRRRASTAARVRAIVLGDLMLDVVLAPDRPMELGTDVPGEVQLRAGGSAANTARWLARLGVRTTLVAAVGRDPAGRSLVESLERDGVVARVARIPRTRTGRIGVLVAPNGERSFVADRGAADRLSPEQLDPGWFKVDVLHLPAYSLIGEPIAAAGRRGIELARAAGAAISLDLASIGPLLGQGRRAAVELVEGARPDLLFATVAEAEAVLGRYGVEGLLDLAPVAVVKRGAKGATVMARQDGERLRFEVATEHVQARDTTGAGDAFDAGFLAGWFAARGGGRSLPASLQRAALAGHRAAARQLRADRVELALA